MSEYFRNALQQWLDQLEQQSSDGASWLQQWQSTLDRIPDHSEPQAVDLLQQMTRLNQRFEHLAQSLLEQSSDGQLSRQQLLDTYRQHLDGLCHDWINSSCFLPDQLALLSPFLSRSPDPAKQSSDIESFLQRIQQLSSLPRTLLQHSQNLLSSLILLQQAQHAHQQQLSHINQASLNELADRLEPEGVNDIQSLHTLWVDIFEARFNNALRQPDFIASFNQLVDAGSRVRADWQALTDHLCKRFGLVSLAEYDELSLKHQTLQDRVWQLEQQMLDMQSIIQGSDRDKH